MRIPVLLTMLFAASTALGADFSVKISSYPQHVVIEELAQAKFDWRDGFFFPIKVEVTNTSDEEKAFKTDDDCSYASWMLDRPMPMLLTEKCRSNVRETTSLHPGQSYSAILRIWIPWYQPKGTVKFKVGFIELLRNDQKTGPYWSDKIKVKVRRNKQA